ncbi:hypothetical protein [Sphingomicrobium aestuariivivum]|uniref:hypothetical protein n=1 Tax=Sphingomicrobium aestuariivivum TaxID=1582356 RepID=UPI001FD6493E|nr:hypothetical protein [Sphingomicrobium aestuariivivum]MCJ8189927.1 hypothetical protein [Sphingomicrobium aestuariivivum]
MRIELFYGLFGLSMLANALLATELVDGFVHSSAAEELAAADRSANAVEAAVRLSKIDQDVPAADDSSAITVEQVSRDSLAFVYDRRDL